MPPDLAESLRELIHARTFSPKALAERLAAVHPIDIAVALQYLDEDETLAVVKTLDDHAAAEVLDETDEDTKRAILERVDRERLADLVDLMPPDEGADLLELAPDEIEEVVLERVERDTAQDIRELQRYEPDTAGGQMTTEFVALREDMTATDAIRTLQGAVDAEQTNWVHVTDAADRLAGYVSIAQLISAPGNRHVADFMHRDVQSVTTDLDQETVARLADHYNLQAVPVTDTRGVLKGIITLDDVMDVMSEEASEDMFLLAGSQSVHPLSENVLLRVTKRMPWLLVTVGMGLVVMFIYSRYEPVIRAGSIWLVFFVPIVQALGGNVGIQSSTLVVRGLATGDIGHGRLSRVILTELAVGLTIGVLFGLLVGLAAGAIQNPRLGLVVALAIPVGVLSSSFTGTVIPLVCNRVGVDPAVTAGPFITALNDLICLTIYFSIASLVFIWLI
ncbi:MAG TPA: magnesium transporter [Planctomycetota bacterium]|nr:magnesium transporter [Planctomycetota bacterium]